MYSQLKDNGKMIESKDPISNEKSGEQIGSFCGNSIATPLVSNNGNQGIMFDVQAVNDIIVSGFDINLSNSSSGNITVYSRVGTHVGFESSAVGWTNEGTVAISDNGTSTNTHISLPLSVMIPAGTTMAFYLNGDASLSIDYSDGTSLGNTLISDPNIVVKEGSGISAVFGSNFQPRNFEGVIQYCIPKVVACDTITTRLNNDNSNSGIFFDISATSSIQIQQIYADFNYIINAFNLKLYSRSGSHVGFENSAAGWTLHSDNTMQMSAGMDVPRAVANSLAITIPAGGTRGFYLITDGAGVDYSNDVDPIGTIDFNDGTIQIRTGGGNSSLFSGIANASRNFNGVIDYCLTSGVDEIELSQIDFYPNPASDNVKITVENKLVERVSFVDVSGKLCLDYTNSKQENELNFNVSELKEGVYFVTVLTADNHQSTIKFIKK